MDPVPVRTIKKAGKNILTASTFKACRTKISPGISIELHRNEADPSVGMKDHRIAR